MDNKKIINAVTNLKTQTLSQNKIHIFKAF